MSLCSTWADNDSRNDRNCEVQDGDEEADRCFLVCKQIWASMELGNALCYLGLINGAGANISGHFWSFGTGYLGFITGAGMPKYLLIYRTVCYLAFLLQSHSLA